MGRNSFIYPDDGFGSQPDKCYARAASFIQRKELSSSVVVLWLRHLDRPLVAFGLFLALFAWQLFPV